MDQLPVVRSPWRIVILLVGYTFLYAPMLMLVIYSFDSSRLVTVWAGWFTQWYHVLVHDNAMISAVTLSMTLAAVVIVRFGRFRGTGGFAFMLTAPLGHAIGWPAERGMFTIWLAHVTFCTAYVVAVVNSRLRELDQSIEEAAMDLGATPVKVFFIITLPMLVFSSVRMGVNPEINALATLILVVGGDRPYCLVADVP